ncbi:MAG: EAL domain-containing protein [Betaproteobacteria bacterium]|nr:EAL domain-containing protein [Betaproteobacteria bacterium]
MAAGAVRVPAMILDAAGLAAYETSAHACWVQDVARSQVTWANDVAVRMLRARSREELFARDVTPLSASARTRLANYLKRIEAGMEVTTQWTTFTGQGPVTFVADVHGFRAADGSISAFFDAREITDFLCPETLRMLAAARHSMAYFSLYALDGRLIERNSAFVREFGGILPKPGDNFLDLFADKREGDRFRDSVITHGEARDRFRLATLAGERWHLVIGLSILDPVDGRRTLHVESMDITDQVEAEFRMRDSQALLQQVADEFQHPISYVYADRTFGFINRTYAEWLKRPREAVIGRTVREVAGPELDAIWDGIQPKLMAGERVSYERRTNYPGRGERWIQVDVVPHTGPEGAVSGAFVFGYDVHAIKQAESHRKTSERQLDLIANSLPVAIIVYDSQDRVSFANRPVLNWFGVRLDAILGRDPAEFIGAQARKDLEPAAARARRGEVVQLRREWPFRSERRWVDFTFAPFDDGDRIRNGVIVLMADVTKRVQANEALYKARNALSSHLENTPLAVMQMDAHRRITQWSGRATEIFGWTDAEAFGRALDELGLFEEESRTRFDHELQWLDQGSAARFTLACRNRRKDGFSLHGEWFVSVLREDKGDVTSYLALVQDVSARVSAEHHLHYVANHDVLTGLANRSQFQERLKDEMARAKRLGQSLAVVLLDLDRFKYVNESLGHAAGDALLQQVALRFSRAIGPGDLIARTGGDEFMMLVNLEGDAARGTAFGESIRQLLDRPFRIGEQDIFVTVSIGVAFYPQDAGTEIELIKNADWAMYRAKDAGRNGVQFFSRTLAQDVPMRLSMESELHRAAGLGQLELHYQPKQNLTTRRITGAEALLRWRHPVRGLVPPDDFIALAEETGLINEIGQWVIGAVCKQLALWRANGGSTPHVAINLSPVQLKRRELAREILDEMAKYQLPGSALMVEVTETAVVSDPLVATISLEILRENGVHTAIDDFGKGFSSLTQLKRLPIDALKIDGSFVRGVVTDRDDAAIVQAIIGLAKNLDLHVVAEGVETAEQMSFLTKHGCGEAQGYLISRPLPADDFAAQFLKWG